MKYEVTVTSVGEIAFDLLTGNGCLIIFDKCPLTELEEIAIMHTTGEIKGQIQIGDKVTMGKHQYVITAIGDEALKTLQEMGHCTFCFGGKSTVDLPGQIELKGENEPVIEVGDKIIIA